MPPRLPNDPMRYIRRVRNGMYQARPYDEGERYNLGLFPTWTEAARAIQEFWRHGGASWYRRLKLHRVREVKMKDGTVCYDASVTVRLGRYKTPEEAHAATVRYIRGTEGIFAEVMLKRR